MSIPWWSVAVMRGGFAILLWVAAVSLGLASAVRAETVPRVVASIKPIHALAAGVMAGVATPKLLVQGGQSAHTYALRPSDARALHEAQLILWAGPSIEGFLVHPLEQLAPGSRIVTLSEEQRLVRYPLRRLDGDHHGTGIDGHVWLDPRNAQQIVAVMGDALAAVDPGHAAAYRANVDALKVRLQALDHELETQLAPVRHKPYVVFHDAYQYFEKRYRLNGAGALAISPELPSGARTVGALRKRLLEGEIVCAFAEPQFEPKLLDIVTAGTATKRGVLDSEGAALAPGPDLYFVLLRNLGRAFVNCLGTP